MSNNTKKQKTNFGNLLQQYREEKNISQLKLERLLWKDEYPITNGVVNRYESGERTPPPRFIRNAAKVLALNDAQINAIVNAHFADYQLKFWSDYNVD